MLSCYICYVISDGFEERIAVIVNEFGEAGLDHDLIETASDDVVLMASGCLCCTIRGEWADTMIDLRARQNAGAFDFDRLVIETTGLADPGLIFPTMLVEYAFCTHAVGVAVDFKADHQNVLYRS